MGDTIDNTLNFIGENTYLFDSKDLLKATYILTGKVLSAESFRGKLQLGTKNPVEGIYILKIETNRKIITKRIIIN